MARGKTEHGHPPIAGSRLNVVSVLCVGFVVVFVLLVLTLIVADLSYLGRKDYSLAKFWDTITAPAVLGAIWRTVLSSLITLMAVILFSVPIGYALSRYRFWGHTLVNTIVDMPIVLPPIITGISLLVFFGSPVGREFRETLEVFYRWLYACTGWRFPTWLIEIVLCQFLVSVSFSIRACKASFDAIDRQLEHVAMTLGCSPWRAFWRVAVPLAANGIVAGSIMAWARAVGVFGPIMVFVGTMPRATVMPTLIWLEVSTGGIEVAIAITLVMLVMAAIALAVVHWLAPGRKWM